MFGTSSHDGLVGLQGLVAFWAALGLSPRKFLFKDVVQRGDVAKAAVLKISQMI